MNSIDVAAVTQLARDTRVADVAAAGYRIHSTLSGWMVIRRHGPGGRVIDYIGTRPQITEAVGLAARHKINPAGICLAEAWRATNQMRGWLT
jgi:hypothetical protein